MIVMSAALYRHYIHDAERTRDAVHDLLVALPESVPQHIERLRPLHKRAAPALQAIFDDPSTVPALRLRAAYGLAAIGQINHDFLADSIADAPGAASD